MTDQTNPAVDFDAKALREKYKAERDKRIRTDGNEQYLEMKGQFAQYNEDPYVAPGFERAPLTQEEFPTFPAEAINRFGDLRTTPAIWADKGGMDGFFAARLVRGL